MQNAIGCPQHGNLRFDLSGLDDDSPGALKAGGPSQTGGEKKQGNKFHS